MHCVFLLRNRATCTDRKALALVKVICLLALAAIFLSVITLIAITPRPSVASQMAAVTQIYNFKTALDAFAPVCLTAKVGRSQ